MRIFGFWVDVPDWVKNCSNSAEMLSSSDAALKIYNNYFTKVISFL